ncbi:hypothetical protein ABJI51_29940 [Amycolatopsis sp. NEAU-NG30]|uniref:Extracellular solute-binding protein n=1 Tax=Amycolatopsis melonis TaxID=3156488 RepID=A0ABV0LLY5_9PSEU
MGRHYRDEEPVPHPQDRTPNVPAEGRPHPGSPRGDGAAPAGRPGAFRTPGRSSISDAFGIAGRATGSSRIPRRGEQSGSYPVAGRSEASGDYPITTRRTPASGAYPAGRRGEASGAYPVETVGEPGAAYPAAGRGTPSGSYPTGRRGETSGAYPVTAEPNEPAPGGRRRRGRAPAAEAAAERTEVITRADDSSGSLRTLDRTEDTGSRRTTGRGKTTRGESTGPKRAARTETTGPQRRSEGTGSHRVVGKGEATGSHRIVGKKAPRRRIATWPIACLVLAVLIGLGVVGWNWADNELNSRAEAQASACQSGTTQMRIVVTPSVQKPLTVAADRWNQAATVVHGQCVHVTIEAKASSQVLDALVGRASLDSIGGLPAGWLPESSYWVSELTTKKPEMIGAPAQSVATARSADYPFIGLAGPGIDDTALRAAQTFREYLEQPAQQADFAAAGIKAA